VNDITSFLVKAAALLSALEAAGIVQSSSGIKIASILADVTSVVNGTQHPTAEMTTQVTQLLTDLGVSGPGLDDAKKFGAFVHDVQANQVAIIDGGKTLFGVRGAYAYIPAASEQGVSLGLS
jgi:hypothetical protein